MCSQLENFESCPRATKPWLQAGNTVRATISPSSGALEHDLVTGPKRQCYYGWPMSRCFGSAQADRVACGSAPNTQVILAPGTTKKTLYPFRPRFGGIMRDLETSKSSSSEACRDWVAPFGARSVQIAPNVWSVLPNNIPPAVAINAYHHDDYINDIYDHNRKTPFGKSANSSCCRR